MSATRQALGYGHLEGRVVHDLRRSAVRYLVNAGVSELTAMKLTGHKTRAVFDRYYIISPSETSGAIAKLVAIFRGRNATRWAQSRRSNPWRWALWM